MSIRLLTTSLLSIIIILHSCHSSDKDRQVSRKEIFNSHPFASLTDSISRFPEDAGLYLKRGELLTQQNFHEFASGDFKKAWQLHADEPTALAYTSSLFLSGQEETAIGLLQECAHKFPASIEFSRRLSEAYVQRGEIKNALDEYNQILQRDSANFDALYQKGILLARLKDTAAAIEVFEKAYKLQPMQLYGISLADLYAKTKNAKAVHVCNQLIGTDSLQRATEAVFIKGVYFGNTHQYEQALQQYEACIKKDWKFTEAYVEKGIILFNQQNIDEALNTFAIAAKVSVTYPDAYYWMGRCYEKIGKTRDAVESYERTLALDRDYPDAENALKRLNK